MNKRKYERKHEQASSRYQHYNHNRKDGFGMNLYRNTKRKKIGGVCAGLADHFEIDANIMRIIFVAAFLFTGSVAFWVYLVLWIVLSPKGEGPSHIEYEYDEYERCYRKRKLFRYQRSAGDRLKTASGRLKDINARIERMERYVTSRKFDLKNKFADLER